MLIAIKRETDSNTIIVRDVKTPLSSMDRSSIQNMNKKTQILNDKLDQIDLIDIFRASRPKHQNTHYSQVNVVHIPSLILC